jgi:hypothetical protein
MPPLLTTGAQIVKFYSFLKEKNDRRSKVLRNWNLHHQRTRHLLVRTGVGWQQNVHAKASC